MPPPYEPSAVADGPTTPPDTTYRPLDKWDWFKTSRDWILNAEKRIGEESDAITAAIKWYFGMSSGGTLAGILFGKLPVADIDVRILTACVLAFLLSYALASFAKLSRAGLKFHALQADDIRAVYNKGNRRARWQLYGSGVLMVVGIGLFPLIFLYPKAKTAERKAQVNATYTAAEGKRTTVANGLKELKVIRIEYFFPGKPTDSLRVGVHVGKEFHRAIPHPEMGFKCIADSAVIQHHTLRLDTGNYIGSDEQLYVTIEQLQHKPLTTMLRAQARNEAL